MQRACLRLIHRVQLLVHVVARCKRGCELPNMASLASQTRCHYMAGSQQARSKAAQTTPMQI